MSNVLTLSEAVRKRPAMYLAKCFVDGNLDQWPLEMACDAVDAILENRCRELEVQIFPEHFVVRYDSGISLETHPSIPLTSAEIIFTQLRACQNMRKYKSIGDELCQIGIAIINCACAWCELVTIYQGKRGFFRFEKGMTTVSEIKTTKEKDYTIIKAQPDFFLLDGLHFTKEGVKKRAYKLSQSLHGFGIVVC